MLSNVGSRQKSVLDFGVILEGLLANPESYVNFGEYWWTLKRMLADWADENGKPHEAMRLRTSAKAHTVPEMEESEVYQFLKGFSCAEDFQDWISVVNPRLVWDEAEEEEISIEDPEWEEHFL